MAKLLHTFRGYSAHVNSIAFSPDGGTIASGSKDNTIKLWDVNSKSLVHTFQGHSDWVQSVAFSPDGGTIASASDDKTIKLWDVNSKRLVHTFQGHSHYVFSVMFSPDGRTIASGSNDGTIKLWDVNSKSLVHTFRGYSAHVNLIAFSPDGRTIAGSKDNTIKLWDVNSKSLVHTFQQGHSSTVKSVAFSPDGGTIASGSWDNTIKLWDVNSKSLVHTFQGHRYCVFSVAFSPDGGTIASASKDTTIKLWDVNSKSLVHTFQGHSNEVMSVAFSPDGGNIASASNDKTIKLWDASEFTTPPVPPVPPVPPFFTTLEKALAEKWSTWRVLEKLSPEVSDTTELKIFYTMASAAYKLGEIGKEEWIKFVSDVLHMIPEKFKFDQDAQVVATVKIILEKARADGILNDRAFYRLDQQVENAQTFADARFTGLVDRLQKLELRMDRVEDRVTTVETYARNIDASLTKFKKQMRQHLDRKAAASMASAVIGIFTLGAGSGITGAIASVCDTIFSNIIDFSDTKHVLNAIYSAKHTPEGSDLAEAFMEDKIETWVDKPLAKAVHDKIIRPEHVQVAAVVQASSVIDVPVTTAYEPGGAAANAPPPPPPPQSLGDAAETFAKLKKSLELDSDAKEISIDDDFMFAFQDLFQVNFTDINTKTETVEAACRALVDTKGQGTIKLLHWKVFFNTFTRSGISMTDYLKSKIGV